MTITLFIEPKSLVIFLEVTKILKGLELENFFLTGNTLKLINQIDNQLNADNCK